MLWDILLLAIAVGSALFLWFLDVWRTMCERRSIVDSARKQLADSEAKVSRSHNDPEAEAVLARSRSIYRQAVVHYDQAIARLRYHLPALLMGFPPSGCSCKERQEL